MPTVRARLEAEGVTVVWLPLGLDAKSYELVADFDDASITAGGVQVTTKTVRNAAAVVHRRWRLSPPLAPVGLTLEGDPEQFGQREWTASLDYALWLWSHSESVVPWGNLPGRTHGRMTLCRLARESGLRVPPTALATRHSRAIPRPAVTKAIATNESVYEDVYFPTTRLSSEDLERLMAERSPCPNLVQKAIAAPLEVRVVYSFGNVGAVALRRTDGNSPVDIRYAPCVVRSPWRLSDAISARLRDLAARACLSLYTADFVIDEAGEYWVVDVTPEGCLGGLDDEEQTLVTSYVEGIREVAYAPSVSISA